MELNKRFQISHSSFHFTSSSAAAATCLAMGGWCSLTEPVLLDILRRLDNLRDFFAFLGVCRGWRALASGSAVAHLASSHHPLLLTRFPNYNEAFYDIVAGHRCPGHLPWSVSFLRSIAFVCRYLVAAADSGGGSKCLLWEISTGAMILLPPSPKPFDRVIFSSPPGSPGCLVLAFKNQKAQLQLLQFGDTRWEMVNGPANLRQTGSDLIFFENDLYILTCNMQLILLNLVGPPKAKLLGWTTVYVGESRRLRPRCLAVSGEDLLAICDKVDGGFIIFRWQFDKNYWQQVLDLGGRALFVDARGFSRSIAGGEMGVRGDCIYYLDCYQDRWFVFSLEEQATRVVHLGSHTGLAPLPPVWVFPR